MSLELVLRITEILIGLAFLQQCAEHLLGSRSELMLFVPRALLSCVLIIGFQSEWTLLALCGHSVLILHRYDGPYNGGSDRMGLLILYCLCLARWAPNETLSHVAFAYLAIQVVLSYFISGQVKIMNPEWRSGNALKDIFNFSAYPVSENLRRLANRPKLLLQMSWAVMLFEVLFPLSFLSSTTLTATLLVGATFHLANACLFGLNRFVWVWIASYPSLLWLQSRFLPEGIIL